MANDYTTAQKVFDEMPEGSFPEKDIVTVKSCDTGRGYEVAQSFGGGPDAQSRRPAEGDRANAPTDPGLGLSVAAGFGGLVK